MAEGEEATRAVHVKMLTSLGCQVTAVASGLDCLACLSSPKGSPRVDAVLFDLSLPEMDGLDLARRIKQMMRWLYFTGCLCTASSTKVYFHLIVLPCLLYFRAQVRPLLIVLTGRCDPSLGALCGDAGVDQMLYQPITVEDLGASLLELGRATRRL